MSRRKYFFGIPNTTQMPTWCSSFPIAIQDRSPAATLLPVVTLLCLSVVWSVDGSRWAFPGFMCSNPTGAQTPTTTVPPRISLLSLQGCLPESWHGHLSASCAFPARSSSSLIHPPARDRLLRVGLCNKQNVHCIRKAFLRSAFSSVLFIFIQQQKQMFCGVFASPDVPLKALSAVQSRCWFLENRKSCGKLAIWQSKLNFLGAQSAFFPVDTPWLRIHLGVLRRVPVWLRPSVQTAHISAARTLAWAERVFTHRSQLPRHTNSLCDRLDFWSLSHWGGNVMITWRLSMKGHCKKQIKWNHIFWLETETHFTPRFYCNSVTSKYKFCYIFCTKKEAKVFCLEVGFFFSGLVLSKKSKGQKGLTKFCIWIWRAVSSSEHMLLWFHI